MKKFVALLLAVMMVFTLCACGGSDEPAGTGLTDMNGNEVTQDTITKLTEAYNAIAVPYNEVATAANENGWMADEQTAAEINALSSTLGFIGAALTDDLSMLDGSDFDTIIEKLENDFPTALDILSERVSVPYGEG